MRFPVFLLLVAATVVYGNDSCVGVSCDTCLNEQQHCLYISENDGQMKCIFKKELLKYRFVKVASKIEKCEKMQAIHPNSENKNTLNQAKTPQKQSNPSYTAHSSNSFLDAPPLSIHKPGMEVEETFPTTEQTQPEKGFIDSFPKKNENPPFNPMANSSGVQNTISDPDLKEKINPINQNRPITVTIAQPQPETKKGDNETGSFVSHVDLFNFSFGSPFSCNDTDLKKMDNYPVKARYLFSACRLLHLAKKMQKEMELSKTLMDWNDMNPAKNDNLHCNFLRFYKTNCGRKFA